MAVWKVAEKVECLVVETEKMTAVTMDGLMVEMTAGK